MPTTTVTTSLTTIATIPSRFAKSVGIQIANTGANLNAFIIQGRCGPDAAWVVLQATDPTSSPRWGIVASSNLVTLATGSNGLFTMPIAGFHEIRVQASVASGTTEVTTSAVAS